MDLIRIYPIRFNKSEWKIPLYCNHICGDHCKYLITEYNSALILINNPDFQNGNCNLLNKLEKAYIKISDYHDSITTQGKIYDSDMKVINDNSIQIYINFPISKKVKFIIPSVNGFTINDILISIKYIYKYIYDIEEATASKKTFSLQSNCYECPLLDLKEIPNINNEDCCICYEQNDNIVKLNCNHIYDKKCIEKWKDISNSCPICRNKIYNCIECNGTGIKTYNIESAAIPIQLRDESRIRNTTDGIYGIHTFYFEDLIIEELIYNRINNILHIKLLN